MYLAKAINDIIKISNKTSIVESVKNTSESLSKMKGVTLKHCNRTKKLLV